MDELLFTGIPIQRETVVALNQVMDRVCYGMTDSEKRAYDLGISNTISIITALLEPDDEPKLFMPHLETSIEMTLDEVIEYFCKE